MSKRERIYIAGPYQANDCSLHDAPRVTQHNVDKAITVANALIERGHYVFCPHVSHYIHTHASCHRDYYEWWYEEDLTFLDHWATALFFIDHSRGSSMELERAKQLGLTIYTELDQVGWAH